MSKFLALLTYGVVLLLPAGAVTVRIHNGTPETVTVASVVVAAGVVESVPLTGTLLAHSRTTGAGVFEAWAAEVSEGDLVSLQPAGRLLVTPAAVDWLAVFMAGFTAGCLWELVGLMYRVVQKTASMTTGV